MKTINQSGISHDTDTSIEQNVEHKTAFHQYHKQAYTVAQPFSEKEILYLQELFLTNGCHWLRVKDIHTGRSIVLTLLYSLNYYHDVAYLSINTMTLDSTMFDVYAHMLEKKYLEGQYYDMEDFLIEHFYADFLWIEETCELQMAPWYTHFLQALNDLKLDKHIPLVFLSYRI